MNKHNLEETIKGKVALLLEQTMEKSWGIYIPQVQSDITDKLQNPLPGQLYFSQESSFAEAKKKFKSEFLQNQIRFHGGNISQLAKFIGLDRRSVHRAVHGLGLPLENLRRESFSEHSYQEAMITQTIHGTLQDYKDLIQPHKMEKMYQQLPALSRNLAKILPCHHLTWKQAEREFEKQFLFHSLQAHNWKIAETARKIAIRSETLHRKIVKLGLR